MNRERKGQVVDFAEQCAVMRLIQQEDFIGRLPTEVQRYRPLPCFIIFVLMRQERQRFSVPVHAAQGIEMLRLMLRPNLLPPVEHPVP